MMKRGFTLVEMLVVIAMTSIIVSLMVTNFNRSRNDLAAAAPGVEGSIRRAQNFALSGSMYNGAHRCGFGVTFSASDYTVYAGPVADGTCGSDDNRYTVGDDIIERVTLPDTLEFRSTGDVYFVPPLPYTYLNGEIGPPRNPAGSPEKKSITIQLGIREKACDVANCREVTVDSAGRVTTEFR